MKLADVAAGVHDPDLPVLKHRVGSHDDAERFFRGSALGYQVEPPLSVGRVPQALGCNSTHARAAPGHDSTHVGELRLYRDTEIAGTRVVGYDAVGVGELQPMRGSDCRGLGQQRKR